MAILETTALLAAAAVCGVPAPGPAPGPPGTMASLLLEAKPEDVGRFAARFFDDQGSRKKVLAAVRGVRRRLGLGLGLGPTPTADARKALLWAVHSLGGPGGGRVSATFLEASPADFEKRFLATPRMLHLHVRSLARLVNGHAELLRGALDRGDLFPFPDGGSGNAAADAAPNPLRPLRNAGVLAVARARVPHDREGVHRLLREGAALPFLNFDPPDPAGLGRLPYARAAAWALVLAVAREGRPPMDALARQVARLARSGGRADLAEAVRDNDTHRLLFREWSDPAAVRRQEDVLKRAVRIRTREPALSADAALELAWAQEAGRDGTYVIGLPADRAGGPAHRRRPDRLLDPIPGQDPDF